MGEELHRKNVLENDNDIFFLTIESIVEYSTSRNPSNIADTVRAKKIEFEKNKQRQHPVSIMGPECIMKTISNHTKEELRNLPPNILKGMPTSAGIIEGTAVVCSDPETAVIKKGDILVAHATDPGWTPLFIPAAGAAGAGWCFPVVW